MIIENESPLIKVLLNDLSYLLTTSNIKKLISIMTKTGNIEKNLEVLLHCQAFKTLFYTKVKAITSYKGSFEQFYDKYLDKFCKSNKACLEVL